MNLGNRNSKKETKTVVQLLNLKLFKQTMFKYLVVLFTLIQ